MEALGAEVGLEATESPRLFDRLKGVSWRATTSGPTTAGLRLGERSQLGLSPIYPLSSRTVPAFSARTSIPIRPPPRTTHTTRRA